jgi:hypothetical protein
MRRDGSIRRDGGRSLYAHQSPVMPIPTTGLDTPPAQPVRPSLPPRLSNLIEQGVNTALEVMARKSPVEAENMRFAIGWLQAVQKAQDAGDKPAAKRLFSIGPLRYAIENGADLTKRHPSANADLVRYCKKVIQDVLQAKGAQP